ncbi:MAG: flagellar filament capping protein FliD [Sulfurimonas sp.]|nr:flagellar filament capping protein FliD [Sulfurimonas sp.]
MGISALGTGSGILTQDLLDQLRASDEAVQITPIDLSIAFENDKKNAFEILDAKITNFNDSVNALKTPALFDERLTAVTGTSVAVTAAANSDLQDFTLDVTQLATKQIEQSGSFGTTTDLIATAAGSMNLNVDGVDFTINYDATTTLSDLKTSINTIAGDKVNATIVQIATGDYRLFLNSVDTGSTQDITITDIGGNLSDDGGATAGGTKLTTGLTAVQTGIDANFTYNGQAITRTSNNVTDLITGYDITLQELGVSQVSVSQNTQSILEKVDSFVTKYNDLIDELSKLTQSSVDSAAKGIFSGDSTIKSFQRAIENSIGNVGEGVASMYEFGFDVDKSGKLSLDSTLLSDKVKNDGKNVEAIFSGGDYTNANGVTTTVTGMFTEMYVVSNEYAKSTGILGDYQSTITAKISSLEDNKLKVIERLDSRYEILKKQYAAYDLLISRFNNTSNIFTDLQNAASNN